MSWYEYLIIIFAAAFVAFVIVRQIVRRKQGKTGCDCCDGNCARCSRCAHSRPAPLSPKKK